MRKIACFYLILLAVAANAQSGFDKRAKIGWVFGTGSADVINFKPLDGGGSHKGKGYFVGEINYVTPFRKWFSLETGIEYSHYKVRANSAPLPVVRYWDTEASIIAIPVNARFSFLKYFYAQAGLLLDIDISRKSDIDRQTGIGANLGLGAQYNFNRGLSLFLNPYLRHHGLLAFNPPRGVFSNDMLWESGVKLGIIYALSRRSD